MNAARSFLTASRLGRATPSPTKRRRRRLHFPLLFALWPVLEFFAKEREQFLWHDLPLPLLLTVLATAALWGLTAYLWRDAAKAGCLVSVGALCFLLYDPLERLLLRVTAGGLPGGVFPWLLAAGLAAVYGLYRLKTVPAPVLTALHVMGWTLLAIPLVQLALFEFRHAPNRWALRRAAAGEAHAAAGAARQERPNLFFIVPDGYGRADVLQSHYGLDNGPLISALEERGFFVARSSAANYIQTLLSLSSSLNLDYVQALPEQFGLRKVNRAALHAAIVHSRVRAILANHGYRFVALASGYPPTELRAADEYRAFPGMPYLLTMLEQRSLLFRLRRRLSRAPWYDPQQAHRDRILHTFAELPRICDREAPVFVFAHIIAPHPPFVFDRHGPVERTPERFDFRDGSHFPGSPASYRAGYKEQLLFINARLLESIDAILATRTRPTLIVLQSDHGPGMRLAWGSLERSDVQERFGILLAFRFPDADYPLPDPAISPVNTFRHILSALTDRPWPDLPNRHYFSTWPRPFEFIPVTESLAPSF